MNNSDKLKTFIASNKEAFDDQRAPAGAWEEIENQLDKKRGRILPLGPFWLIAASLVLVIFVWLRQDKHNPLSATEETDFATETEYTETQRYFVGQVNEKWNALKEKYSDEGLDADLKLLDEIEADLREEYKQAHGEYKEVILNALINNYQTKLSLLQKVMYEVESKGDQNIIYHEM